jgi:hypothetical protein
VLLTERAVSLRYSLQGQSGPSLSEPHERTPLRPIKLSSEPRELTAPDFCPAAEKVELETLLSEESLEEAHPEFQQHDLEVDIFSDPLVEPLPCSMGSAPEVSQAYSPRRAVTPDQDLLRAGDRSVLSKLERKASGAPSAEQQRKDKEWVENAGKLILKEEDFVAGGFGRHLAAWEELLKDSDRASSKKVIKWLRQGVSPSFVGTGNTDPKKLEQVRALLRRTVPTNQVESYLSGDVPRCDDP